MENQHRRVMCKVWADKHNRVKAVKSLMNRLGKNTDMLTQKDFMDNGLQSLLRFNEGSLFKTLADVGYTKPRKKGQTIEIINKRRAAMKDHHIKTIHDFIVSTGKEPWDIQRNDFKKAKLNNLLLYFNNDVYSALCECGFKHPAYRRCPVPIGYWDCMTNRVAAVKYVVNKSGKNPIEVTMHDFDKNGLTSLLKDVYHGRTMDALTEVGYDVSSRVTAPRGFWKERENRVEAIRELVAKYGNDPSKITESAFEKHGVISIINSYGASPRKALLDAGYKAEDIDRGRQRQHGFWKNKDNRVCLVKELVDSSGLPLNRITANTLREHGLDSVIQYHHGSVFKALLEAGYDRKTIREGRVKPKDYWTIKENRIAETKALVQKLGKPLNKINNRDFYNNGLSNLRKAYQTRFCKDYEIGDILGYNPGYLLKYNDVISRALAEAGFDVPVPERIFKPPNYWKNGRNRQKAILGLAESLHKIPEELAAKDFRKNHMGALLRYFNGSKTKTLASIGVDVHRTPLGHWKSRENRIVAIKNAVLKAGKNPQDIRRKDIKSSGILGMLHNYYRGNLKKALLDAGLITENELPIQKGYWKVRANRIKAVRDMVNSHGGDPSIIQMKHFKNAGIIGMLHHYNGGSHRALLDAGYTEDEINRNKCRPWGYWDNRDNRIKETRDLVKKLGKPVNEIIYTDFTSNGLSTLITRYFPHKLRNIDKSDAAVPIAQKSLKLKNAVQRALAESGYIPLKPKCSAKTS